MTQAKNGDTVRIHYTGKLTDGTEFGSSAGQPPLEFVIGSGQVLSGLEKQIDGMELGSSQTLTVPAEEAYGEHDPSKVQVVPRSAVTADVDVRPGQQLQAKTPDGGMLALVVTNVDDQKITVDANHPLAGRDLVFDVQLVDIVRAA
jgi:peptidylprolyl isomerase